MNELITAIADCKKRFVIPLNICKKYRLNKEWSSSGNTLTRIIFILYGFVLNVPSDRNIIGIVNEEQDKEVDYDSDEIESS